MLPTTLEASRATDKSHGTYCNLLNNTVLARRTRTWPLRTGDTVASDTISGLPCVAWYCVWLYNNRAMYLSFYRCRGHARVERTFGKN
jgi:hypothetical protein